MIEKVLKRDNKTLVDYDSHKIKVAISKANLEVPSDERISETDVDMIIQFIESASDSGVSVENIQDIIEERLMAMGYFSLAKVYISYRYKRALLRKANTTDDSIMSLIKNSNKRIRIRNLY